MAISLGSNIASLQAQAELGQSTSALTKSYQRLSSGLRINQASDDAAGLAIASGLNSKARVFTQAIRNVNDGASAASIAEGALTALKQISQRQLELAEEAANGTYSTKQRGALNTEANALVDEYNRIVSSTTFNGIGLLDPSLGSVVIQAGYGKAGTLQLGLSDQLKRAVGDGTFATSGIQLNGYAVAAADFNGDGKMDILSTSLGNDVVLLGNGDGTFSAGSTIAFSASDQNTLDVGDLNGDGKTDFVSTSAASNVTSIFLGNGNGTFASSQTIVLGTGGRHGKLADINGDGKLDLVMALDSGALGVALGNGNGTFQTAHTFITGGEDVSLALGDFNGDGKLDAVTADYSGGANQAHILIGNGDGTFQSAGRITTGLGRGSNVSSGDLNGDGQIDLVVTDFTSGNAVAIMGNGDGTFRAPKTLLSPVGQLWSSAVGDFDGDGRLDIFSAGPNAGSNLFIGNGDGTFKAVHTFAVTSNENAIALTDFNSDGRLDALVGNTLLIANGGFSTSSKYLNINTQQGARDAINTVNGNLDRIEGQLGSIGATSSRFQTALATLQTESENFQAAQARIEDVDVASETANLTRTQILQQASASVLAQANQQPALALKLLA